MANTKLHIICGSCGCYNAFKLEIAKRLYDHLEDIIYLKCRNCSTLHDLREHTERQDEDR